jgi:hypothetical protein
MFECSIVQGLVQYPDRTGAISLKYIQWQKGLTLGGMERRLVHVRFRTSLLRPRPRWQSQ